MNKKDIKDLKDVAAELKLSATERSQINKKVTLIHDGLFGKEDDHTDTGLKGAVLLNTIFRRAGQKFIWIFLIAFLGSAVGAIFTGWQASKANKALFQLNNANNIERTLDD